MLICMYVLGLYCNQDDSEVMRGKIREEKCREN